MTEKMYLTKPYTICFVASMVSKIEDGDGTLVELDRTCFYPESGGQPCDTGHIDGNKVTRVTILDGRIYHHVNGDPGDGEVECQIDWERRFDHMQQHTGQHILSQSIHRLLGKDSESLHMGRESSSIDIPLEQIDAGDLSRIEDLANDVVFQDRLVKTYTVDSVDGLDLRKSTNIEKDIRIVEIEGYDRTPCGGTHLSSTGQVGMIVISKAFKKGKYTRIEFICGRRCLQRVREQSGTLQRIGNLLMVPQASVAEGVEEMEAAKRELVKSNTILKERLSEEILSSLERDAEEYNGVRVIRATMEDPKIVQNISRYVQGRSRLISLMASTTEKGATLMFSCSPDCGLDMGHVLSKTASLVSGKGGGSKSFASGSFRDANRKDEAMEFAHRLVRESLDAQKE